jgi:radical SAM superfamily enzyme YgiQ (UPF0313 family)
MNVLILDYNPNLSPQINRSQTGAFGLQFRPQTLKGKIIRYLKEKSISLPSLHSGHIASLFFRANCKIYFSRTLQHSNFDILIFHATMPGYKQESRELRRIKQQYPKMKIVIWGTFPSLYPSLYTELASHLIIGGEPENGIKAFIENNFDYPLYHIPSPPVKNIDDLELPYWEPFIPNNFKFTPFLKGSPVIPYSLTRGCYYNCSYCHYMPNVGSKERRLSLQRAVENIKKLTKRYNTNYIYFRDLVFTSDPQYILKLFQILKEQKVDIKWACETRGDCLTEELIDQLYSYGLRHINIGIESPDIDTLNKAGRRPPEVAHQEKIIRYNELKGITVAAFYIVGFPNQTIEEIKNTFLYAQKLNTLGAQFCVYTPYPGTKTFSKKFETIPWEHFTGFDPTIQSPSIQDQLKRLVDNAVFFYIFRWKWIRKHWKAFL